MFKIENKTMYCTRGDKATISVTAKNGTDDYEFQVGDVVRFKVFEKKDCSCVKLQKDVTVLEASTSVTVDLTGSDTTIDNLISKPIVYWYEIELNPETQPQTIVGYDTDGDKQFILYPEGAEIDE